MSIGRTGPRTFAHVRAEILLDEDHTGRDYAATLNDPLASGTLTQSGVIADGMAQMSEKFNAMGQQVYVDAERVKESNKAL